MSIAMSMEATITKKLQDALAPESLDVVNESHQHSGHAGSPGTGESHFRVTVVSEKFSGRSRVERHRLVNDVLAEEMAGKIHALALHLHAPGEV